MSQFKPYPVYKDSGVEWIGEVPSTWEVKPFKWLLSHNDGGVWGDDPTGDDDTLVLRSTDQTVDGNWRITDPALRKLSTKEKADALLVEGDLVVTKSSGSSLHIGKTTLVTAEISKQGCCYGNFMQRLRVNSSFTPKLAWYVMNNELARSQLDLLSNSTTGLANLNGTLIGEILLPVSTVAEQTQIARFLDHETARIDALIKEQQRLIELLKEKRQALISHAVTKGLDPSVTMKDSGVEWLGEVPAHWEVTKFKWPLRTASGGTPPSNDREAYYDGGIPWLRSLDLTDDLVTEYEVTVTHQAIEETSCKIVPKNSVLIAMYGGDGTIGKNGLLTFDSAINQAICAFLPSNRCSPEYLHRYIQFYRPYWMIGAESSRKDPNIGQDRIGDHFLTLPPLQEQLDIVGFTNIELLKFSALVNEAQTGVELLQERRSALISAAVTGKIDLRGWQPPASTPVPLREQETA